MILVDLTEPKPVSLSITETQGDRVIPHTMKSLSNEDTRYQISFIPMAARQHTILISSDNQALATHHVDVFNVNKIRVSEIQDGLVGLASIFTVDTHGAGEGHLEVTISDGRRTLPAELKRIQARKFDIGFMPEISGQHSISIAFNGMPVERSPFVIRVRDPPISEKASIEEDKEEDEEVEDDDDDDEDDDEEDIEDHEFLIGGQLEGTKVGELAWLICNTPLSDIYEDFDLFVTGRVQVLCFQKRHSFFLDPDQNTIKHTRIQDSAGRWRIEFEPMKAGIYQIHTNDQNSDESPIILASMDILAESYHRHIEGERIIHPQVLNYISINSKSEHLKIQLRRKHEIALFDLMLIIVLVRFQCR